MTTRRCTWFYNCIRFQAKESLTSRYGRKALGLCRKTHEDLFYFAGRGQGLFLQTPVTEWAIALSPCLSVFCETIWVTRDETYFFILSVSPSGFKAIFWPHMAHLGLWEKAWTGWWVAFPHLYSSVHTSSWERFIYSHVLIWLAPDVL